ncbi:Hypothetical predicted protein, partial [Paramuricea clavata]
RKSINFGESRITEADDDSPGSEGSLSEKGEDSENCGSSSKDDDDVDDDDKISDVMIIDKF